MSGLRPRFEIAINGNRFDDRLLSFIQGVDVQLANDKADLITLTVANPVKDVPGEKRSGGLLWNDSLVFMPGGVVEVFMGYDNDEPEFVGAGIIRKQNSRFPRAALPTMIVKALDATVLMIDGDDSVDAKSARTFGSGSTFPEVANSICNEYGFNTTNIDTDTEVAEVAHAIPKKAGTSDYVFVMGMALALGWDFTIKWNHEVGGRWDAHFKPPVADDSQKKVFTWLGTEGGNLLDAEFQFSVQDNSTDVEVYYYDRGAKVWERVIWPKERGSDTKTWEWKGDSTTESDDLKAVTSLANLAGPNDSRGIRIQSSGVSLEVIPATGFQSAEDAIAFARAWWRARQNLILQGTGAIVGWPGMKPGQVHTFNGLGAALSGDWYVRECGHRMSTGAPYETSLFINKVIP